MTQKGVYLIALFSVLVMAFVPAAAEPVFLPVKVDRPARDPAKFTFWFGPFPECVAPVDMDGDGDLYIANGRNWYENTRKPGVKWTEHPIHSARSMEGTVLGDIAGHRHGGQDLLINHWSAVQGRNFSWYEHVDEEPWLVERILGVGW
jgi:hypothetical protein